MQFLGPETPPPPPQPIILLKWRRLKKMTSASPLLRLSLPSNPCLRWTGSSTHLSAITRACKCKVIRKLETLLSLPTLLIMPSCSTNLLIPLLLALPHTPSPSTPHTHTLSCPLNLPSLLFSAPTPLTLLSILFLRLRRLFSPPSALIRPQI